MQTQDMINQVANAIVSALIDRLTSDEVFIGKIGEKVLTVRTVKDEEFVNKIIQDFHVTNPVNADDINGLDEFVENVIDNKIDGLEIDSDNVSGLDSAIESAVESAIDNMEKESVKADDIEDLAEAVNRVLSEDQSVQTTITQFVVENLEIGLKR